MVYDLSLTNEVFLDDVVDLALQELDILFNTEPTEMLGDPNYGVFFEQFLWDLNPRSSELKEYITKKIEDNTYYVKQFDYEVTVEENDGTENAENIVGDIIYDSNATYIVIIDLYSNTPQYTRHKYSTKVIQF